MSEIWKSQRFDAEGSTTAPGILRQLGRPSLDEFSVLVREAAQNSWDARRGDTDVNFTIRVERLGDRAPTWRNVLLPGPPARSVPEFEKAFDPDSWCLVVSDRGTKGLGGPIRATDRPAPGEKNDFVQFLRNVGEPRDKALGGGTYGFGKGIFYRTSSVRTIIGDSRVSHNGGYQRRLMGASLGDDFWDDTDTRYTGRHWWGRVADDVVDPVIGSDADSLAETLGLPGFEPDESGTNVVVIGADLGLMSDGSGYADPHALGVHLASAMLWNLWPKFRSISPSAETAMRFAVSVDGKAIKIPSPLDVLSLRPFVESFLALDATEEHKSYRRTGHPRIHVGDLAVKTGVVAGNETSVVQSARPFVEAPHHVARMRQAGLVVDYFSGPPHPDPLFAYGGVFRATAGADKHFAAAEPPTHDSWNPQGLEKDPKAIVEGSRRWVREYLNRRFLAAGSDTTGASTTGLGQGSRRLSALVAGVGATGADPAEPTPGGGSGGGTGAGGTRPLARLVGDPWIASHGDALGVFSRVRIDDPESLSSVRAHLDVVLDGGGREGQAPAGAFTPQVLGWSAESIPSIVRSGALLTGFGGQKDWVVVAQFSDAAVTRFRLEVEMIGNGA